MRCRARRSPRATRTAPSAPVRSRVVGVHALCALDLTRTTPSASSRSQAAAVHPAAQRAPTAALGGAPACASWLGAGGWRLIRSFITWAVRAPHMRGKPPSYGSARSAMGGGAAGCRRWRLLVAAPRAVRRACAGGGSACAGGCRASRRPRRGRHSHGLWTRGPLADQLDSIPVSERHVRHRRSHLHSRHPVYKR